MGKRYKCSYCGEVGHNVRGCSTYKNLVIVSASKTLQTRTRLKDICVEQGFGVGCLVSVQMRLWDNSMHQYITVDTIGTVEEIFWKHLFWRNLVGVRGTNGAVRISFTHPQLDTRVYITTALPPSIQRELGIEGPFTKRTILEIVSKTKHLGFPEDYFDFEAIKKDTKRRIDIRD
tara:strand:+ start:2244 stop:2768 length:525 start_codon:yes stop_codon:yes gene_type:complete